MERLLTAGVLLLIACVSLVPYRFLDIGTPLGNLVNYLPLLLTAALLGLLILLRYDIFLHVLKSDVLLGAIVAFVVVDILAAVGGVNSVHSLSRSVYYFLTGPLIFWVIRCAFRSNEQMRTLLIVVSVFSGIAAVYGISEFASGGSWLFGSALSISNPQFAAVTGGAQFTGRILGTVGHPVAFGAFLLLSLPASLYLASKPSPARLIGIFAAASSVVAMVLTFSRGAWISLAIAASVWVVARPSGESRRATIWRVLLVSALLIAGGAVVLTTRGAYAEFVEGYDKNPRILAYVHTATLLPEHLMTGSGIGTFRWLGKPLGSRLDAPDNMFLSRLIESGVLGLATLLYLLQRIFTNLAISSRERRLFLAVLLGIVADMMTFDLLSWPATRSWFWIQLAVGMGAAREQA